MKEVIFKVQIDNNQVLSVSESLAIEDNMEGKMEIIGILENLKQVEHEKIKTLASASSVEQKVTRVKVDKENKKKLKKVIPIS